VVNNSIDLAAVLYLPLLPPLMADDAPQGPWYPQIIYVQRGQTPPIATDAEAARLDDLMPPWLFEPSFLRFMDSHTGHHSRKRARVADTSWSLLEEVVRNRMLVSLRGGGGELGD
jgi:hypothetical protein